MPSREHADAPTDALRALPGVVAIETRTVLRAVLTRAVPPAG